MQAVTNSPMIKQQKQQKGKNIKKKITKATNQNQM
jgi:hypothetical protein